MADLNQDIANGNSVDDDDVAQTPAENVGDLFREGLAEVMASDDAALAGIDTINKTPKKKEPEQDDDADTEPLDPPKPADKKSAQPKDSNVTSKSLPKDPNFVDELTNKKGAKTQDPDESPDDDNQPDTSKDQTSQAADTSKVFSTRLSELTNGVIKNEADFREFVTNHNKLLEERQKGFEPKFKSDAHKKAFDLLTNVPAGQEVEAARRVHHALSLDPSKMKGKDLLLQGYLLDPENADLSLGDATKYFEAWYEKNFAESDSDLMQERELKKAESKAKELIQKLQADYTVPKEEEAPAKQGPSEETLKNIRESVDEFGGLELAFSENAKETDMLKIPMSADEATELLDMATNPGKLIDKLIELGKTEDGYFDYSKYIRTLYEVQHHERIKRMAYDHGFKLGRQQQLNKDRNSSDVTPTLERSARVKAADKEPATFAESMLGAFQKAGMAK